MLEAPSGCFTGAWISRLGRSHSTHLALASNKRAKTPPVFQAVQPLPPANCSFPSWIVYFWSNTRIRVERQTPTEPKEEQRGEKASQVPTEQAVSGSQQLDGNELEGEKYEKRPGRCRPPWAEGKGRKGKESHSLLILQGREHGYFIIINPSSWNPWAVTSPRVRSRCKGSKGTRSPPKMACIFSSENCPKHAGQCLLS